MSIFGQAIFMFKQRLLGFDIPDEPHFDPERTAYFKGELAKSERYLEYGSGGSTVEAARQAKAFTTVDSDFYFLAAVARKIGNAPNGTLLHADIGITGPWGYPTIKRPSPDRLSRWANYARLPWQHMKAPPDLILIDGRFRVNCALTAIKNLRGRDFTLLFDDYGERRELYRIVENYADLKGFKGCMAIFGPKSIRDDRIDVEIARSASDYN